MTRELENYISYLFDANNPIFISILILIFLLATIFIFIKYIIFPILKNHDLETNKLKLKNARLLALFTQIDPDPVIRIDLNGVIINYNKSALNLSPDKQLKNKHINSVLPNFDYASLSENGKPTVAFNYTLNGKYYRIIYKAVRAYGFSQLYFNNVTDLTLMQKKLKKANKQLEKFSNRLHQDIEDERTRIARDLHDEIGQNLLLVQAMINSFSNNYATSDKELEELKRIKELQGNTLTEIKKIINNIKPVMLEEMGIVQALHSLVCRISKESGISGTFDFTGEEERFDAKFETDIYRVCQEGLNNIIKHSSADMFNIQFRNRDESIKIIISDNGKGITKAGKSEGMGLLNIKKRVEFYGGSFRINSEENNGAILIIDIPKRDIKHE